MLTFDITYFMDLTCLKFLPFNLQQYTSFPYCLKKTHTDTKLQIYKSPLLYIYIYSKFLTKKEHL